jgi:hypothetical protein
LVFLSVVVFSWFLCLKIMPMGFIARQSTFGFEGGGLLPRNRSTSLILRFVKCIIKPTLNVKRD